MVNVQSKLIQRIQLLNFRRMSLAMAKRDLPAAFSHIKLGMTLWRDIVNIGDIVVDCTCGNGRY